MKGRTHCLNDFVFVFPQIPNLLVFGGWQFLVWNSIFKLIYLIIYS
ncbi:hypothetical protein NC651_009928 [Populus alba x Populus x berolinensis]|nr:hypothetical protein NC651_009928 [Populus alba x Populus x berolinensis]